MRLSQYLIVIGTFALAAVLAVAAATVAVGRIETSAAAQIESELRIADLGWASVAVDGLQVTLTGTAPDEATRFRAISLAGKVVDPTRVIDAMAVDPGQEVTPPRFSIEILRNAEGISLIGLVPGAMDRAAVVSTISEIAEGAPVTDLLESANYPEPEGWDEALSYGLEALARLPRSKISVAADAVAITAITESLVEKRQLEASLQAALPDGVALQLDLSAPRPVITPFTLRFLIDDAGPRFDACSAHTETGRARIIEAAREAGLEGEVRCTLGLGVPSPRWPDAVEMAIAGLDRLGGGSVTFSDADITLIARDTTDPALFDEVVGELESALPEAFTLHAVLPEPVDAGPAEEDEGPPRFVATLSPERLLQLRGRITDTRLREAVIGFARAKFSGAQVYGAMRVDADLPEGWPRRVLAGLEALSRLDHGSVVVQPDYVELRGKTGDENARAEVARILSAELGEAENFSVEVEYQPQLKPISTEPTPEECVSRINGILSDSKIVFAPGSSDIPAASGETLDRIAEVMRDCRDVPMEIGGHTDSQGRESMNLRLSQARANAVLDALMARRVLTRNLSAKGYGESRPIADNDTEEGREANRRIEFRLVGPAAEEVADPELAATEGAPAPAAPGDGEAEPPPSEPADGDVGPTPDTIPEEEGSTDE